jgi:uncharacterized protein (TIGR02246 family)
MMRGILILFLLGLTISSSLPGQSPAANAKDDAAVREIVKKYMDARDRRDAKAVEALFTEDADQLVSSGVWRKGRPEIVKGTLESSDNNPGKRILTVETIRYIDPAVALADARYEIAGEGVAATRKMWSTFLMKRGADGWRIAAIRNMLPAGGR